MARDLYPWEEVVDVPAAPEAPAPKTPPVAPEPAVTEPAE